MNLPVRYPADGLGRLAHALPSPARSVCWTRCSAAWGLAMIALLLCDLPLQLGDVFLDARLLIRFGTR